MSSLAVVLAHEFAADLLRRLQARKGIELRTLPADDLQSGLDRYPDSEVLYTLRGPAAWNPRWNVRWIQLHSAGAEHLDLSIIPEPVRVTTASGVHSVAMAEHGIAMTLVLLHRFPAYFGLQEKSEWRHQTYNNIEVLRGKTIGILGYGSIGREVARLAVALGMRVLAMKRDTASLKDTGFRIAGTGDPEGKLPARYFAREETLDLMRLSDVVVDVLPLTRSTRHQVDASALAALRPGSVFVNLGRGGTVDEPALIEELSKGRIQAGLDVTETEPLPPDSPLWRLPNCLLTPHVSGDFKDYDGVCIDLFVQNLERYEAGRPLLNEVDRGLGY